MGCIYFYFYEETLLYVGSSFDIKTRQVQHKSNLKTGAVGPFYRYLREQDLTFNNLEIEIVDTGLTDKTELIFLEGQCVLFYKPKCNIRIESRTKEEWYRENVDRLNDHKKQYYEVNKNKINEQRKLYRESNKGKITEQSKKYYENNREKKIEQSKKYYENNKDKKKEYDNEYYESNKEKIKEKVRLYREVNIDKIKEYDRKRRAAKKLEQAKEIV